MRRGEIAGMIWEMVDLKKRTVTLPETKNGVISRSDAASYCHLGDDQAYRLLQRLSGKGKIKKAGRFVQDGLKSFPMGYPL